MPVFVWSLCWIFPVFYQTLSGALCRDITRQVPKRMIELKILFTVSNDGMRALQRRRYGCWQSVTVSHRMLRMVSY